MRLDSKRGSFESVVVPNVILSKQSKLVDVWTKDFSRETDLPAVVTAQPWKKPTKNNVVTSNM